MSSHAWAKSGRGQTRSGRLWYPKDETMIAIYPFESNGDYQLSVAFGDEFKVQERTDSWLKGILISTGEKGIVPANYFVSKRKVHKNDVVLNELNQVLIEWCGLLKEYYKDRRTSEFKTLKEQMKTLLQWHSIITSPHIKGTALEELKTKVMFHIEEGRRLLGLDIVVKRPDTGVIATENNTNIMELYRMHREIANKGPKRIGKAMTRRSLPRGELKSETEQAALYSIQLQHKILMCPLTEPAQLFWSIYHSKTKKRISEEWTVNLTKQGLPEDVDKIDQKTIFKGIPASLLSSGDLYLVARILRKGVLTIGKPGKNTNNFRRPFAGAILKLSGEDLQSKETEPRLIIYGATTEAGWPDIFDLILRDQNVAPIPKSVGITIGLQLLKGHIPAAKDVDITQMLFMPETIVEDRNDFYVTIDSAEVSQDRKRSAKNVEVSAVVRDRNGNVIENAIQYGTGEPPQTEYKSVVFYHSNTPKWGETICIRLPQNKFNGSHIFFSMRHCTTKKPKGKDEGFAYAYMPLTLDDSGTVQNDGSHTLSTYKPMKADERAYYLTEDTSKLLIRRGEHLKVNTFLCSSIMTQNSAMLGLLRWDAHRTGLKEVLRKFTFVDREEIIKFLPDTVAALFSMLNANEKNTDMLLNIYDTLTHVIGHFTNVKFADAKEALDECLRPYTDVDDITLLSPSQLTAFCNIHLPLLFCLKKKIQETSSSKLAPTFKGLGYLMKLVICSYQHHSKSNRSNKSHGFKDNLWDFFKALNKIMISTEARLIGARILVLKNFDSWFTDIYHVFSNKDVANIIGEFLASVPYSTTKRQLNLEKMRLLAPILSKDIFTDPESQEMIAVVTAEQIGAFLNKSNEDEELNECLNSLSLLLGMVQQNSITGTVFTVLLPLVQDLIRLLNDADREAVYLGCTVSLLGVIHVCNTPNISQFFDSMDSNRKRETYLLSLLRTLNKVIAHLHTIPQNWFALSLWQYKTIGKIIHVVASHLEKSLKGGGTEWDLWIHLFRLILTYLTAKPLTLEKFSQQKQELVMELYGDMRVPIATVMQDIWSVLGDSQMKVISSLVGDFLELVMLEQPEIREMGFSLYYSMLQREFQLTKSFKEVERQSISTLDKIVNEYGGEVQAEFEKFFISRLETKLMESTVDGMLVQGRTLIRDYKKLIELLTALRTLPVGVEYAEDKLEATLQLLHYLEQTGRTGEYIDYVHDLQESHMSAGNFAEAALSIMMHAALLEWSDNHLPARYLFPAETESTRKQTIYKLAISYFDNGGFWELAIGLLDELRILYKEKLHDYTQLADVLSQQSSLYRKLVESDRFFPEHFCVGFFGTGFEDTVRNKQFVYRAKPFEPLVDFSGRLLLRYPSAELLKYTTYPKSEVLSSATQQLQIFPLKVSSPEEMHSINNEKREQKERNISSVVLEANRWANAHIFSYDKPEVRKKNKTDSEFACLWIKRVFYKVATGFPAVTQRSVVEEKAELELPPIVNAINSIVEKNSELSDLIQKYSMSPDSNVSPFTMVLKGVIQAAVNGGLQNYYEAFFIPKYLRENPSHKEFVESLKASIPEQIRRLDKGLKLHKTICPSEVSGLHDSLEVAFSELKEIARQYAPGANIPKASRIAPVNRKQSAGAPKPTNTYKPTTSTPGNFGNVNTVGSSKSGVSSWGTSVVGRSTESITSNTNTTSITRNVSPAPRKTSLLNLPPAPPPSMINDNTTSTTSPSTPSSPPPVPVKTRRGVSGITHRGGISGRGGRPYGQGEGPRGRRGTIQRGRGRGMRGRRGTVQSKPRRPPRGMASRGY